jgi:hypothetical protein
MSWQIGRDLLLASLLHQSSTAKQNEGTYDPVKHTRQVSLDNKRNSAVASMVSWHESFHAFLNASTCHGNAMIFAGALAEAGYEEFNILVKRMIDICLITHETYATVQGIATANNDTFEVQLLANYPDYQPLLKSFTDLFPSDSQPVLSKMALAVCARVAMQTPIYDTLLAMTCNAWPQIDLDSIGKPDDRFALLMTSATIERAIAEMKTVLRDAGGQYALIADQRLDFNSANRVWSSSDNVFLDQISKAGFDIFADILYQINGLCVEFNGQKNRLKDILTKVESFAGSRLQRQFRIPDSWEEDEDSLIVDFRNEHLILRDNSLPAIFVSLETHPVSFTEFILAADEQRYFQFVAMPSDKARALYSPIKGEKLLSQGTDSLIAGLRRLWVSPEADPRIEFLVLSSDTISSIFKLLSNAAVEPFILCSMTLLNYPNWFLNWIQSPNCPVNRMCVLIDDDCIELINRHAERGAELQITYFIVRSGSVQNENTEIVCLAASDEPDVVYFTPCSTPFRQSITEYVRRRVKQVRFDGEFIQPWLPILKRLIAHTLREEAQFGNRFWV